MSAHIVKVTILGRKLSIKTDASPEQIDRTVQFIEKKAENLKKTSLATDPMILSLFLNMILADELLTAREELSSYDRKDKNSEYEQVDQLTNDLINLINNEID